LHDDRAGRGVGGGGPEVPLVLAGDDGQQSLVRDEQTRTAACLLEQRLAPDDGAELLGTIVAGERTCQRSQPLAVTAAQDNSCPRHW